jgi:hypothetical protein
MSAFTLDIYAHVQLSNVSQIFGAGTMRISPFEFPVQIISSNRDNCLKKQENQADTQCVDCVVRLPAPLPPSKHSSGFGSPPAVVAPIRRQLESGPEDYGS